MKIKKRILALICVSLIHSFSFAQTDTIVKAKILDDGSQDAEKFYNSGIAEFALKNYKDALKDFDQAIAIKADFEKAYYNRGSIKFEMKDYKNAIADFDKSLLLVKNPESYFSRG